MASLKQNLEKLRVKGIVCRPFEDEAQDVMYQMTALGFDDDEQADVIGYLKLDVSFCGETGEQLNK